MGMSTGDKTLETRCRRAAERRRMTLHRSRRRDVLAVDYGEYYLTVGEQTLTFGSLAELAGWMGFGPSESGS